MSIVFTARTLEGERITLTTPLPVTDDPRLASADFTVDELLAFTAQGDELPAGSSWQVVGHRAMARHGSSALDTEITVRLLAPAGEVPDDPQGVLSQAMMRLALALASPETGVVDPRFSGRLG
ncbi:hypothetical protein [Luteococcus sp. OSA5]|uniref:hypothetical protein n=1 Tax=Luteococcus sp. OSA5 TaxID=3401630 RepID=UPI003B43BBBA